MNYKTLYSQARYYDVIHNRDVSRDLDFFQSVFKKICENELKSLLDLACGPGYHVIEASKRNIRATGIDVNSPMLDYAKLKTPKNNQNTTWSHQDIRAFSLNEKFDIAICLFDTIALLTTNEELIQHLINVSEHINPGGLYIIEMTHPRWNSITHFEVFKDTGFKDGVSVEIIYGSNTPVPDLVTGVATMEVEMIVVEDGEKMVFKDSALERVLCPQELILLAQLSGAFDVVQWFGDFDTNQPLTTSSESSRMICVLQSRK